LGEIVAKQASASRWRARSRMLVDIELDLWPCLAEVPGAVAGDRLGHLQGSSGFTVGIQDCAGPLGRRQRLQLGHRPGHGGDQRARLVGQRRDSEAHAGAVKQAGGATASQRDLTVERVFAVSSDGLQ
jgi:hypothetical protein